MHGAKGSVKNRIYQFWLIRMWQDKRRKKKEKAILKKRKLAEQQKKVIEEVIGIRDTRKWKLSKAPTVFSKKEGVVVILYPLHKKPARVIEVMEEKPKVGIGQEEDLAKKLEKIEKETVKVVSKVDKEVEKKEFIPEELKAKKKTLEQDLDKIEALQKEYQQMKKKNPKLSNIKLIKDEKIKNMVVHVEALDDAERICKRELSRVETALKSIEAKEVIIPIYEKKQELKKETKQKKETEHKELKPQNETVKIEKSTDSLKIVDSNLKRNIMTGIVAGGTIVVFPALITKIVQPKKETKKKTEMQPKKENQEKISNGKIEDQPNHKSDIAPETNEIKNSKLKLYRSKLEASFEAEILIKAELERQKNYLRRMNEKIEQIDISRRVEYRFQGLHHLLGQILTFTLGVFTIPFSRHRIFGTALGLVLIGNSIRGMKNSLRLKKEQSVYIEWKDFTKQIYNEQLALKQLNTMIVSSLHEIKELKEDMEMEFHGKISLEEYEKMKSKLEVIELKLIEKQKQIKEVEEQLQKTEEKNKVKVKQMEEMKK